MQQPVPVKGLKNGFRENNCFLNVVIQSLWNLDSFRTRFLTTKHKCPSSDSNKNACVHCALSVHIFYKLNKIFSTHILRLKAYFLEISFLGDLRTCIFMSEPLYRSSTHALFCIHSLGRPPENHGKKIKKN